tara:strand:+ start:2208 stop:3161 length:954 start_codon:yes stop_codon:yes gene_type:complete
MNVQQMYEQRLARGEISTMVSQTTINKHTNNIATLNKLTPDTDWFDSKNFSEVNEIIKNMKTRTGSVSLSTQHSYISSYIVLCRCKNPETYFESDDFKAAVQYIHKDGTFAKSLATYKKGSSERYNASAPNKKQVEDIIDAYCSDETEPLDNKLLLSIYRHHPFRLEVAEMIYLNPRKYNALKKTGELTGNYLVKSKGMRGKMFFSFSHYKTDKTYGTREIDVKDKKLKQLFYQKIIPMEVGTRVFGTMNRNNLTKRITNIFERKGINKVTPTIMTKLILGEQFGEQAPEAKAVIKKAKELAKERGHSLGVQQNTYV